MEDYQSEFSSIERKVIASIPYNNNDNDSQSNYLKDLSMDQTSNNYSNSNKYSTTNFRKNMQYHPQNEENNDSSDESESGYSNIFIKQFPSFHHQKDNKSQFQKYKYNENVSNYQNSNFKINHEINKSPNFNTFEMNNSPDKYKNIQDTSYSSLNTPHKSQNSQYINYNITTPQKIIQNQYLQNYYINANAQNFSNYQYINNNSFMTPQKKQKHSNDYYDNNTHFVVTKIPQEYSNFRTHNFNSILPNNPNTNFDINKVNQTYKNEDNEVINPLNSLDTVKSINLEGSPKEADSEKEKNNNINNNNFFENKYEDKLQNNLLQKKFISEEELLLKCLKYGNPPPDGDFSPEGWKLFYPSNESFFLWDKGGVIPNQLRIKNENDEDNLEIYKGEVNKNDERHGFGVLTTPKYVRKGTWRNGKFTGWCRESRVNGDIYEGKFIDGVIIGKGINKNQKGNLYIGDFVDNKREGKGELRTKKIHYIGEFKQNKLDGKGKLKFLKEGHIYKGEFKNNEITGVGIFKWSNGDAYEGEMKNGIINGKGKYIYSKGQIYEGQYLNGVKHGLGRLTYPDGKIYEGEFNNGKPHGKGIVIKNGKKRDIIFENGNVISKF